MIISVVIPVYSGADHLVALNEALARERQRWQTEGAPFELGEAIFVDDASIDSSSEVLRDLDEKYDWIRVVTLARNFGQHPATIAGILHTSGDWVVTLDEDLQHDSAAIESLLKIAAETNADIVYARPDGSVHGGYRDVASRMYKRLMVTLTRKTEVASFNSFRLLRGSVARAAASVSGHETYYDIALGWFTDRFESVELPYDRFPVCKLGAKWVQLHEAVEPCQTAGHLLPSQSTSCSGPCRPSRCLGCDGFCNPSTPYSDPRLFSGRGLDVIVRSNTVLRRHYVTDTGCDS